MKDVKQIYNYNLNNEIEDATYNMVSMFDIGDNDELPEYINDLFEVMS